MEDQGNHAALSPNFIGGETELHRGKATDLVTLGCRAGALAHGAFHHRDKPIFPW